MNKGEPLSIRPKMELLPILLILFVYALAFLPRIDQFGFYKDDWHMIYHGHTYGANQITDSFLIDRPVMGQINRLMYLILGDRPLAWNLFAFVARFTGVIAFYALLRILWPAQRNSATALAALFAVYPGFLQQPNAATFQNHFIGFSLALISIALTAAMFNTSGWTRVAVVAISLLGTAGYLWIYEYMIGLEVFRLAVLVYMIRRAEIKTWKHVLSRTFLAYLPHLVVVLGFLVWRFFIFSSNRPATNVELITANYLAEPLKSLASLFSGGFKDLVSTVWLSWSVPLYVVWQDAGPGVVALALLLAGCAGWAGIWAFRRVTAEGESLSAAGSQSWGVPAMVIGAVSTLGALIPVALAGRLVYFGDQFDRYTLHASPGVILLAGGALFTLLEGRLRAALFASMLGIAVMVHSINGAYWAEFWKIQQHFWWQVAWRAPALEDGTILISRLPPGFAQAEDYEIFSPVNLVYHPEEPALRLYGEILNASTAVNIVSQNVYSYRYIRFFELERDFRKTLIVYWQGAPGCAHFIDGTQPEISAGSDALLHWTAPYSRIDLIQTGGSTPALLPDIFGPEPDRAVDWCYTYQKASLARQKGDWAEVIRLYQEAAANGLSAADPIEWLPFYQAFMAVGDQDQAEQLVPLIRSDLETFTSYCVLSKPDASRREDPAFRFLCEPLMPQD